MVSNWTLSFFNYSSTYLKIGCCLIGLILASKLVTEELTETLVDVDGL